MQTTAQGGEFILPRRHYVNDQRAEERGREAAIDAIIRLLGKSRG